MREGNHLTLRRLAEQTGRSQQACPFVLLRRRTRFAETTRGALRSPVWGGDLRLNPELLSLQIRRDTLRVAAAAVQIRESPGGWRLQARSAAPNPMCAGNAAPHHGPPLLAHSVSSEAQHSGRLDSAAARRPGEPMRGSEVAWRPVCTLT